MSKKSRPNSRWRKLRLTPLRDLFRGRVTGRLDWRARLGEADLDDDARALIGRVVKKTRLWRMEKADLTEELIAHFADGMEAYGVHGDGRDARPARDVDDAMKELIADFGDEKQAAKLIRRAKKRNRPWAWKSMVWSMRAIGMVIVLYVIAIGWYATGTPDISVNYLAKFNAKAKAVPKDEQGWPIYREALLHHGLWKIINENAAPIWMKMPDQSFRLVKPSDKQWPEAVKFLREHQKLMAMVREAASKPGFGFISQLSPWGYSEEDFHAIFGPNTNRNAFLKYRPKPPGGPGMAWKSASQIEVLLPQLAFFRSIVRGLIHEDMLWAVQRGNGAQVLADVDAIFSVANQAREMPALICDLVAHSILSNGFKYLAETLAKHSSIFNDTQLVGLEHKLASLDSFATIHFAGERMLMDDTLQRIYDQDGNVTLSGLEFIHRLRTTFDWNKKDLPAFVPSVWMLPAYNFVMPDGREVAHEYNVKMAMVEAYAKQPLWVQLRTKSAVDKTINSWKKSHEATPLLLLEMLSVPLSAAARQGNKTMAERVALEVAVALELYRREHHGVYPKTLAELVPRYLPKQPVDFSTGKPLLYKIVDGHPLLYGRGLDGDDDGGRIGKEQKQHGGWYPIPKQGDWILYPYPGDPGD